MTTNWESEERCQAIAAVTPPRRPDGGRSWWQRLIHRLYPRRWPVGS